MVNECIKSVVLMVGLLFYVAGYACPCIPHVDSVRQPFFMVNDEHINEYNKNIRIFTQQCVDGAEAIKTDLHGSVSGKSHE